MPDRPPTNLRSLDDRLRNHGELTGPNFSRARRHMSALVVAQVAQRAATDQHDDDRLTTRPSSAGR